MNSDISRRSLSLIAIVAIVFLLVIPVGFVSAQTSAPTTPTVVATGNPGELAITWNTASGATFLHSRLDQQGRTGEHAGRGP